MAQTINERFLDFQVAQQIKWIRLSNSDAKAALASLRRVDDELARVLASAGLGDGTFTTARAEALKAQVQNLIRAIHNEAIAPAVTEAVTEAAVLSAEVEEAAFKRVLPAGLDVTTPNIGVLQNAATIRPFSGGVLSDWTTSLREADLTRSWRHILDGITSGETTDNIIRGLNGTRAARYKDGVRQVTRRGTEALVRTAINHATNIGRQMVWEKNDNLISSVRWVATLDTRTTPICRHRDGRVGPTTPTQGWKPPGGVMALEPQMARPPAHPNCRSTTVAVLKSWKELGFNVNELTPGTRAAMNGQVPGNVTYYDWLRRQSAETQEDALGPERFKMWKDKGVKPERFVNDAGRLLTLDQLRKKIGDD